jgi:hypothetical protein
MSNFTLTDNPRQQIDVSENKYRMKPKFIFFTLFIILTSHPLSSLAEDSILDPSRVKWTSLDYKTYILFFSMNVKAELKQISQASSKAALLTPKQGEGTMPLADPTYRIDLDTKIMGRKSFISLWFDPNGNAFQRTQTDTGSKKRLKTYRITKNGYYSRQAKPKEQEQDLPPNQWTDIGEGKNIFNKLPPVGTTIVEPTALYYLVSASSLNKPGDKFQKYMFTKHGIYQLNLQAVDYEKIEVNFKSQQNGNKTTTKNDEYKTLHIRMNAVPIDPAGADDFDFLGLKGDIDLYIDPASRVLVQISGDAAIIGYTDIKLQAVTY